MLLQFLISIRCSFFLMCVWHLWKQPNLHWRHESAATKTPQILNRRAAACPLSNFNFFCRIKLFNRYDRSESLSTPFQLGVFNHRTMPDRLLVRNKHSHINDRRAGCCRPLTHNIFHTNTFAVRQWKIIRYRLFPSWWTLACWMQKSVHQKTCWWREML